MDRREVLIDAGTLAVASSGNVFLGATTAYSAPATPVENLIVTSMKCHETGLKCERLCTETLAQRDISMGSCMVAIPDMLTRAHQNG